MPSRRARNRRLPGLVPRGKALHAFLAERGFPQGARVRRGGPSEIEDERGTFLLEVLEVTIGSEPPVVLTFVGHADSTAWYEARLRGDRLEVEMRDQVIERYRSVIGRIHGRPSGVLGPVAVDDPPKEVSDAAAKLRRNHDRVTRRAVAAKVGIGYSTLREWIRRGVVAWPPADDDRTVSD